MYGYIKGKITYVTSNYIIIDNNGIGYIIFVANPYSYEENKEYLIYTYNYINENENSLYGFISMDEKELFLKLVPIMIISIVFCFSGWTNLSSFGMIMFWGFVLIAVYNIIVTKTLLKLRENK